MIKFKIFLLAFVFFLAGMNGLQAQKTVLVITETVGFDHNTRDVVVPMITQLGVENGFIVESTNSSTGYFTSAKLTEYDAILFMNTTGDFLNADEQVAFEQYINNGGGAFFNHAAADAEYDWSFYHQLLGATFQAHYYGIFSNDLIIADSLNIATSFLEEGTWTRSEEYYYFTPQNEGGNVPNPPIVDPGINPNLSHLLLIDNETSPHPLDIVHPVSWYQYFEGGRSWYTVFGHGSTTYEDEDIIQHMLGGILFAMGAYDPNGPAMSVTPQTITFGMKEGDHSTVPAFEISVTNATPSLGDLMNLTLLPDQEWVDISTGQIVGDKVIYTCSLNEEADALSLGEHTLIIEISADSVLTQYTTVNIMVSPGGPNLALNKPITASSIENAGTPAAYANDGNQSTRWSSQFNDGEYITIDLEASYSVNFVKIFWEGAFADAYEILMGDDPEDLSSVYIQTAGQGENEEITLQGSGRYLRLLCNSRATPFGSSLWEIEAYGSPTLPTSIPHVNNIAFSVYPSLLYGNELTVVSEALDGTPYLIDIISLGGESIAHFESKKGANSNIFVLPSTMRSGVYYVRFSSNKEVHYLKIFKLNE